MKYLYILFFSLAFLFSSDSVKADGHGDVVEETTEETSEDTKKESTEEK